MAGDVLTRVSWARSRAGLGLAALVLGACTAPPSEGRRAPPAADDASAEPVGSARRPKETLTLVRSGERCEVIVEADGAVLERGPEKVACPKDLPLGERVRLAGRACFREGGGSARERPTVCPDALRAADAERRARRADAGP